MFWTVHPGHGLGSLSFGMTPEDVKAQPGLGRPGHVYRGSRGRVMEYRGLAVPICEYGPGGLNCIIAGRKVAGVRLQGTNIFDTDPEAIVRLLESRLGPAQLCQEQLCFPKAGLLLGGFFDAHDKCFFRPDAEYHDERSVTIYMPGACGLSCETEHELVSFL
ncbi:hypothetical protein BV509_07395 [Rhodovulum sulfidophilum]|uniref:Uncharacterized protein n=1 Tax=Rhodovulum visakhapatnamense TaxID=364297 RepID=A0ABS1RH98_9RHOB|nr:hypothetical protein [Rhodovulum visakhapatnamense]MBL3571440.1 hypothetical protein [Rhodovulum visakhapatnamense]MBL3578519.1 hypothetical protein [Rhodovulum visakhapatnamense]OLS44174.1 hypothetical protein BV509_07395 [Rhodovulum sulfidophilum]